MLSTPPPMFAPFLRIGARRHIMFPESGTGVPAAVRPVVEEARW